MSHFCLGVLLELDEVLYKDEEELYESDIEYRIQEKLERFCEDPDAVPEEYLEFNDNSDEVMNFLEVNDYVNEKRKLTFREAASECGYQTFNIEGEEKAGYYYNPNGKWDWFQVGGRWENSIKLKDGTKASFALLKDIDFSKNKNVIEQANRFWELYIEKGKENLTEEEKKELKFVFYKPAYYIDRYKTKENYANQLASFSTYAVLDTDGEWYDPGDMGWFGISSATPDEENDFNLSYYDKFIKNKDFENTVLVMVDCHI